jgi:hypothetical protein
MIKTNIKKFALIKRLIIIISLKNILRVFNRSGNLFILFNLNLKFVQTPFYKFHRKVLN